MLEINLKSAGGYELIDVTGQIQKKVTESGVRSGLVLVYVPHTTAGIICNENETNLLDDIIKVVKSVDENSGFFGGFRHDAEEGPPRPTSERVEAGNAHAHIVSAIGGNSRSFMIEDGQVVLGRWQSIMFLEMDGPRARQLFLKIISS